MVRRTVLAIALGLVVALGVGNSGAADLPTPLPPPIDPTVLQQTLERSAALYLIRASFDVMSVDDIPSILETNAAELTKNGPQPEVAAALTEALTAEGSYAIVSLRYLISAGSANWPTDRDAGAYEKDALAKLAELQHEWLAAVQSGSDLRPLLLSIDQINAQTEGFKDLPASLDRFG
eukprot:gene43839-59387_t